MSAAYFECPLQRSTCTATTSSLAVLCVNPPNLNLFRYIPVPAQRFADLESIILNRNLLI